MIRTNAPKNILTIDDPTKNRYERNIGLAAQNGEGSVKDRYAQAVEIPLEFRIKNDPIVILPPSPKTVDENNKSFNIPISQNNDVLTHKIQHSNAMFDPNNESPVSEFMSLLKLRMSVYFEQEINIFN